MFCAKTVEILYFMLNALFPHILVFKKMRFLISVGPILIKFYIRGPCSCTSPVLCYLWEHQKLAFSNWKPRGNNFANTCGPLCWARVSQLISTLPPAFGSWYLYLQTISYYLKMNTESSLWNVLNKKRMMDYVQKYNICINVPSSYKFATAQCR